MNDNLNLESCESQNKRILAYLEDGNRVTGLEAISLFGCIRLAARISELRSQGHNIRKETITTPTGKRIAQYFI